MALTAHDRLALRRALAAEFSRLAAAYRHLADLEAVPGWYESLDDEGQEAASADYRQLTDAAKWWGRVADDYAEGRPLMRGPAPAEPEPELAAVAFAAVEARLLRVRAWWATRVAEREWDEAGEDERAAYEAAVEQEVRAFEADEAAWGAFSDFIGMGAL